VYEVSSVLPLHAMKQYC